jgi:hypothetical protein
MVKFPPLDGVQVIGITGQARHGKDTLAQMIVSTAPGAERLAFSDGIAAVARARGVMGLNRDAPVLQDIGFEMRQTIPQVWLNVLYGAISDRRPRIAVITGVRFEDEADMIREMGGIVVRMIRLCANGTPYESPDRPSTHPVEMGMLSIRADMTFTSMDGDMQDFPAYARSCLNLLPDRR